MSVLLAVVMLVCTVPVMEAVATSKSLDEALSWVRSQVNKSLDVDGYPANQPYQCVDFIACYYTFLGVSRPYGNGCDYATNTLPSGWTRTKGGAPQPGDILVYTDNDGQHSAGHVAIYEANNAIYHQNWGYNYVIKTTGKTYKTLGGTALNYWGCIHPNFANQPSGHNPTGTVDSCVGGAGCISVAGWAFDEDNTATSINIDVYIGGPAGTPNLSAYRITANVKRTDVNTAYGCGEYHGYEATLDTGLTGTQSIYIYAINVGAGDNVLLGERTVSITNPNPDGMLDSCEGGSGFVRITGWAADADDYSRSLNIHVYIGGDLNTGEGHNDIYANSLRSDVDNAYHIGKYHGFDAKIPTARTGNLPVYVYAINIGRGTFCLLGSKTVYVSPHSHSYTSNVTTAATCTADGVRTFTCSCGASYTEKITKSGHSYGAWIKLNDTQHQRVCSRDRSHVEKANHAWNSGNVTTTATCSAAGVKTYTCTVCNGTKTETIPINSSNHVNTINETATASSCTVKGYTAGVYCNDCKKYISGHVEQPLAAHQTTTINAKEATYDADGYTGDTYCTVCRQTLSYGSGIPKLTKPEEPTNPTNPTNPTQPATQQQQQQRGNCKYCGGTHTGFPGILIGFFHSILALFGLRK